LSEAWRDIEDGEQTRMDVDRLLQDLDHLTLAQMHLVATAWDKVPRHRREESWAKARRIWRATASDEPLDRAFRARQVARRAGHLAGAQDPTFSVAACEATLAVASGRRLSERCYEPLVAPLAQALPWLLDRLRPKETATAEPRRSSRYLSNL
jgi:hypothetical protein